MKIATFDDLNDPFELWAVAQPNPALRRRLRQWKKQMSATYGVLCFSRTWNNPVLWSHYADRHRGVALGFDINSEVVKEVTYADKRPHFRVANEATLHSLLYTKGRDWQYEDEVRVYTRLEERDETTGMYFSDFCGDLILREVVTGPLCTATKSEIQGVLRDENVSIKKGRLAYNSFRVVTNQKGFRQA